MPFIQPTEWDDFLSCYPNAHLLQTSAWGQLKSEFGWDVHRLVAGEAGAQVLFRRLPFGFTIAYIPKGPVGQDWENLVPELDGICRERKAIFLKFEPDLWEIRGSLTQSTGSPDDTPKGFLKSSINVQPQRTLLVDIRGDEQGVLARMKQKTRYNVRLAQKKGIIVHPSADIGAFYRLMQVTGKRDSFGYHSLDYYKRAYELFYLNGNCELLVAEYRQEPLAALMVFSHGRRAWYFYGASASDHRERMPTYLLQWEAIRWARAQGCSEYDLWGVPDAEMNELEANFTRRNDGLWGVYRFKRGFGGQLFRASGPWDRVYHPLLYSFYRWWVERRRSEGLVG